MIRSTGVHGRDCSDEMMARIRMEASEPSSGNELWRRSIGLERTLHVIPMKDLFDQ